MAPAQIMERERTDSGHRFRPAGGSPTGSRFDHGELRPRRDPQLKRTACARSKHQRQPSVGEVSHPEDLVLRIHFQHQLADVNLVGSNEACTRSNGAFTDHAPPPTQRASDGRCGPALQKTGPRAENVWGSWGPAVKTQRSFGLGLRVAPVRGSAGGRLMRPSRPAAVLVAGAIFRPASLV